MKKNPKSQVSTREGKKAKNKLLPAVTRDALGYFTREEAKIDTRKVISGAAVLMALGFVAQPARAWPHNSIHSSFSAHSNQGAASRHSNVNGINKHVSNTSHVNAAAESAHSNVSTHSNSAAVNRHSNVNSHTSQAASSAHSSAAHNNTAAVHQNESLTRGNLHNSGSQGKHSAWTAHGNANESSHVNASGTNTHTSMAALNRHVSVSNHSSTAAAAAHSNGTAHSSTPAVNRHGNVNSHANRAAVNSHMNVGATNIHGSANTHFNHGSHGSW